MHDLTWQGVLDLQIRLSEWMSSRRGREFGAGYFWSAWKAGEYNMAKDEAGAITLGADWSSWASTCVFNAEPIFIEPDMMTVVEAAIAGFQPEPLAETDLIVPAGFLVLPRSMTLIDQQGKRLTWRAAEWHPRLSTGVELTLYHDPWEARDDYDELIDRGAPMLATHVVPWGWGDPFPGRTEDHPDVHVTTAQVHRQVQAIWRLLQQHLAEVVSQRPPRAFAKRAQRAKLPHEHVTIVRLRRPAQEQEPGEPRIVNWTHRWIVGGHWRNQPYKSLGISRQIWISPYCKGPQELELVVNKARIFQLVR